MQTQFGLPVLTPAKRDAAPRFQGLKDNLKSLQQDRDNLTAQRKAEASAEAFRQERLRQDAAYHAVKNEVLALLNQTFTERSPQQETHFTGWELLQEIVKSNFSGEITNLLNDENQHMASLMLNSLCELGAIRSVYESEEVDDWAWRKDFGCDRTEVTRNTYALTVLADHRLNLDTKQWENFHPPGKAAPEGPWIG